jgi:betaine lipid synthase
MGKGSDGTPVRPSFMKKTFPSMEKLNLENMRNDLTVLKNIWFSKAGGGDHAARLESFYGPQAHACKLMAYCFIDTSRRMQAIPILAP